MPPHTTQPAQRTSTVEAMQPRMGLAALLASWLPIEERLPELDDQPIATVSLFNDRLDSEPPPTVEHT